MTPFFRKPPPPPLTETLIAAFLTRESVDLTLLSEEVAKSEADGSIIDIAHSYQTMLATPAGKHLFASLEGLRQRLMLDILSGATDKHGNDLSPALRAAFGVVQQVMALPELAQEKLLIYEKEKLGI